MTQNISEKWSDACKIFEPYDHNTLYMSNKRQFEVITPFLRSLNNFEGFLNSQQEDEDLKTIVDLLTFQNVEPHIKKYNSKQKFKTLNPAVIYISYLISRLKSVDDWAVPIKKTKQCRFNVMYKNFYSVFACCPTVSSFIMTFSEEPLIFELQKTKLNDFNYYIDLFNNISTKKSTFYRIGKPI